MNINVLVHIILYINNGKITVQQPAGKQTRCKPKYQDLKIFSNSLMIQIPQFSPKKTPTEVFKQLDFNNSI